MTQTFTRRSNKSVYQPTNRLGFARSPALNYKTDTKQNDNRVLQEPTEFENKILNDLKAFNLDCVTVYSNEFDSIFLKATQNIAAETCYQGFDSLAFALHPVSQTILNSHKYVVVFDSEKHTYQSVQGSFVQPEFDKTCDPIKDASILSTNTENDVEIISTHQNIIKAFFEPDNSDALCEIKMTNVSLYSSTPFARHQEFWKIILQKSNKKNDLIVADMTGCIGADSCHFARHPEVSNVICFEIDKTNFKALSCNVKSMNLEGKITKMCCNSMSKKAERLLLTKLPDIIYFDSPWNETEQANKELLFDGACLTDVVQTIMSTLASTQMCVCKIPLDYKNDKFQLSNQYTVQFHTNKKFKIAIISRIDKH